jgi:hypothetical protein
MMARFNFIAAAVVELPAALPCVICLLVQATACAFRFLRQPSRPTEAWRMEMCPKLDPLVLPSRSFGRLRPVRLRVNGLQGHLDGIGVKVFGIPNVNGERLRHIAIQSNRHRLFAQGKRERTGCFAGLRRLIWFHVDCDVSARRCGLKTKRLWFWFDRHPTRHPGRRRSTRASREHKNYDAIGRDGGSLPNSHETSSRYCGEPRLPALVELDYEFHGNVARLLLPTHPLSLPTEPVE